MRGKITGLHVLPFGFVENLLVAFCDISEGSISSPHAGLDYFQITPFSEIHFENTFTPLTTLLKNKFFNNTLGIY